MERVSPPQPTRDLEERRKLPQWGLGQSTSRNVRNFMRFHASFSAFSSCLEMGDSYITTSLYWLVGLVFPFNFFGCRSPQLEFLGCSDTHDTSTVAEPLASLQSEAYRKRSNSRRQDIFARKYMCIKINKILEFYMTFARKMPEFYTKIVRNIFVTNFEGTCPLAVTSYAYVINPADLPTPPATTGPAGSAAEMPGLCDDSVMRRGRDLRHAAAWTDALS